MKKTGERSEAQNTGGKNKASSSLKEGELQKLPLKMLVIAIILSNLQPSPQTYTTYTSVKISLIYSYNCISIV